MNNEQKTKVESVVFKKLIEHLQNRTDVQNIDLMNLSGFCRNCLSRWYSEAAEETGLKVDKDRAREIVYGMPYSVWRENTKLMQMKIKKKILKILFLKITNMDEKSNNNQQSIQKKDDKLKSFIERIERLSEEKNNINFDIKEVFSEAKSMGYDPTVMRKILALRKIDVNERIEQETLLNTYKNALGIS